MLDRSDNQIYYYVLYHVSDHDKPHDALPFKKNGKPTPFAVRIYENIYFRRSNENENIFEEIENGNVYYSVIDSSEEKIPDHALPLIDFPNEIRIRYCEDIRLIRRSIEKRNSWDAIKQVILNIKDNPASITTILFFILIGTASAQQPGNRIHFNQNTNDNGADNTDFEFISHQHLPPEYFPEIKAAQVDKPHYFTPKIRSALNDDKPYHMNQHNYPSLYTAVEREDFIRSAIVKDDLGEFMYALLKGYDIRQKNSDGKYTFSLVVIYNSFKILSYVARDQKFDLNFFQPVNMDISNSLIAMAIHRKNNGLARLLIKLGYDINYIIDPENQHSYLHILAMMTDKIALERFKQIVELGANINLQDKSGFTPVFLAAAVDNIAAMNILLEKKCNTEILVKIDDKRFNLLSFSVLASTANTVKYLLKNGFSHNINPSMSIKGFHPDISYPIQSAFQRGDLDIMKLLFKYKSEDITPFTTELLISTSLTENKIQLAYFFLKESPIDPEVICHSIKEKVKPPFYTKLCDEFFATAKDWIEKRKNRVLENDDARKFVRSKVNMAVEELEIPQYVALCEDYNNLLAPVSDTLFIKILAKLSLVKLIITLFFGINLYRSFQRVNLAIKPEEKISPEESQKINQNTNVELSQDKIENKLTKPRKPSKESRESDNINETIELCKKEKNLHIDKNDRIILFNQANTYLNYKTMELTSDCRSKQIEFNAGVKELHIVSRNIKEELSKNKSLTGHEGMTLLHSLQDQLENLRHEPDVESFVLEIKIKILSIQNARASLKLLEKSANNLIESICNARDAIEKSMHQLPHPDETVKKPFIYSKKSISTGRNESGKESTQENVIIPETKIKNKTKSTVKPPNLTSNQRLFKPACKKNREVKLDQTKSIINDDRTIYANELKLLIENIIHDEMKENRHKPYSYDAMLYLLMKSSHLIAQLTSRFTSIVIIGWKDLYHLRNNIIHYPELCFEDKNISAFIDKFYHLFNFALGKLGNTGSCDNINISELTNMCPFIMKDNRDNVEIIFPNQPLASCLSGIQSLLDTTQLYYDIGIKLQLDGKYEHEGLLHSAMHMVILRYREKLKTLKHLDYSLFENINILLPGLIEEGDKIAHTLIDSDRRDLSLEEKKSYAREDISCIRLMDIMRNINTQSKIISCAINDNLSSHEQRSRKSFCK